LAHKLETFTDPQYAPVTVTGPKFLVCPATRTKRAVRQLRPVRCGRGFCAAGRARWTDTD
jgi:ribosomal protein L13E